MQLLKSAAKNDLGDKIQRTPHCDGNDMATDDSNPVDPFDSNTPQYRAYFPEGSRDDVEFRLTRMLSLAARRWGTHVESRMLAATGQSRPRWQTLFVLSVAPPPVTTSLLSARLAIQWPPLIRTLNALEADGLIRRTENPTDKRSRHIEITPAGIEVVEQVQPILSEIRSAVFAKLSEQDMELATRVLGMIIAGVGEAQDMDDDPV
ncbi:DNA-binding MarR family transcriptional regulator [Sphingobium sp. AEW010]|nr:DNA-binding MarR family transcriptional regulator [Sphingobium sp. AEW010]TWD18329.1 DNA-binding MarR family transcriptional regulator [Sphingobium sp. AEW013]TWD20836.1 DNA-binding MarR family transcriptional regulator [Sphingobium sp. AEW001]